jgi:outer membrane protein assembly factor BamB
MTLGTRGDRANAEAGEIVMHASFRLLAALIGVALLSSPLHSQKDAYWPSFRGPSASGVSDGQHLPATWNGITGDNIRWKVVVPGLAHSSPIVWGDRIFLTTAISSRPDATFKPGLYGEGTASEDRTSHRWVVMALDRHTGKTIWERTAYSGAPREKRHIKATYANSTPATDGRYVVAFFGSQGLYGYDVNGKELWKRDLGVLNAGAYDLPEYEWGNASSPIIYRDLAIVQCDTQGESFVMAVNVRTGETVWRTGRKELPSWGTPTVVVPSGTLRPELITNASNFVRGYDPLTGAERWRLGGSSKITAPTPIFARDVIVVASGRAPERPIFAIRPGGTGDITPEEGAQSGPHLVWRKTGRGSYMPTPLVYGEILYILGNAGLFDAYDLQTGREIYRQRLLHQGSGFSASPVAADNRIYLSSEDGEIFVVRTGSTFEFIVKNPMGEPLMATPALAGGSMYVRGEKHVFAIAGAKQQ